MTACQDIIAVLAEQLVIANAARDDVIPGAAMQLIRRAVAEDAVVKVGADNVFDGVQLADDAPCACRDGGSVAGIGLMVGVQVDLNG